MVGKEGIILFFTTTHINHSATLTIHQNMTQDVHKEHVYLPYAKTLEMIGKGGAGDLP
jgi:hypothetical protein